MKSYRVKLRLIYEDFIEYETKFISCCDEMGLNEEIEDAIEFLNEQDTNIELIEVDEIEEEEY